MSEDKPSKVRTLDLNQKILAIRKSDEVAYLQKIHDVSVGGGQRFKAVTHDEVIALFRRKFNEYDIMMWVSLVNQTHDGKMTTIEVDISISSGKSKPITTRWLGHGHDGSDKGAGKAYSYAIKTFFLKTFMTETGENEESILTAMDRLEDEAAITAPEYQEIIDLLGQCKDASEDMMVNYINQQKDLGIEKLTDLPRNQLPYVRAALGNRIRTEKGQS